MKKLCVTLFVLFAALAAVSVSASAAEIGRLSVHEGVVNALIFGENVRIYFAVESDGAVTSVVSGNPDQNGYLEMNIGENPEGKLYLWENGSPTPRSVPYLLKNGHAYRENDEKAVPEYVQSDDFVFDDDMSLVIVSSVSDGRISGVMNGDKVSFDFAENVDVMGYAAAVSEIRAGDIILPALNGHGVCGKIDVMMTVDLKSNGNMSNSDIKEKLGTHNPAHGSKKTVNVLAQYVKKSLSKENATLEVKDGTKNVKYEFESAQSPYTRLIVTTRKGERAAFVKASNISGEVLFLEENKTSQEYYYNYLFMRVDAGTGLVKEAVYICPKTTLGEMVMGGEGWSGLFSLEE